MPLALDMERAGPVGFNDPLAARPDTLVGVGIAAMSRGTKQQGARLATTISRLSAPRGAQGSVPLGPDCRRCCARTNTGGTPHNERVFIPNSSVHTPGVENLRRVQGVKATKSLRLKIQH